MEREKDEKEFYLKQIKELKKENKRLENDLLMIKGRKKRKRPTEETEESVERHKMFESKNNIFYIDSLILIH